MNAKLFFACGTALILLPLFSQQAQAKGETLLELQPESTEIVRELRVPNAVPLAAHESASSHRIVVRCDQLAQYEHGYEHENVHEFEDSFGVAEGRSTDWEHRRHHSSQSRSTIREIVSDRTGTRAGRSLTIEIQGECDDIRLQVEPPSTLSHPPLPRPYPYPAQWPSVEQYLDWYEDQMIEENIPWVIRPGSGWHWFLRDR